MVRKKRSKPGVSSKGENPEECKVNYEKNEKTQGKDYAKKELCGDAESRMAIIEKGICPEELRNRSR